MNSLWRELLVLDEFVDHVLSDFWLVGRDHVAGIENPHEGEVLEILDGATLGI